LSLVRKNRRFGEPDRKKRGNSGTIIIGKKKNDEGNAEERDERRAWQDGPGWECSPCSQRSSDQKKNTNLFRERGRKPTTGTSDEKTLP